VEVKVEVLFLYSTGISINLSLFLLIGKKRSRNVTFDPLDEDSVSSHSSEGSLGYALRSVERQKKVLILENALQAEKALKGEIH